MAGEGKRGQRGKLTKECHDKIVAAMRRGNFFDTACALAGISESTGYKWIAWGEGREYTDHKPADITPYREFAEAVKEAEAAAEDEAVSHIKEAAPKDWKAASEFLRRRKPAKWNQVGKIEVQHGGEIKVQAKIAASLGEYADMLTELAGANDSDTDQEGDDD